MTINAESVTTAGPVVRINCPKCNAKSVPAETFEQVDDLLLFYFIPMGRMRNTFVRCSKCKKQSISRVRTDEIQNYSAEALEPYLVARVPLICQFLAVASVLLFFFPIVGLAMGVIAVLANLKTAGWPKIVSWIGGGLSVIASIGYVIILANG